MAIATRTNQTRYNFLRWRYGLSLPKKAALALGAACFIGLLAQARIQLPWSPVPITGATFAVLLAGTLLGRWWGGVSVAVYAGLGIAGVPWFTGWGSGLAHLAGPTGGYIIGFILAALFLGHFTDKYRRSRGFPGLLGLMLCASLVIIYVPGLIQLGLWLSLVKGTPVTLSSLLAMGALPFIAGDITKSVIAAAIARGFTTKAADSGGRDRAR
jgi:biotin transport system substrate-specific component